MQDRDRTDQKLSWTTIYFEWSNEEFKERLQLNRTNFEFVLSHIWVMIVKQSTNVIRKPIEENRQLIYTA